MKLTGPASRLFEIQCPCSRPGNLSGTLAPKTKPMSIPERLKLKPVNQKLLDEMSALCDAIERELESGETAEALLQRWHSHARRRCDPYEFQTYWKAVSKETFVHN